MIRHYAVIRESAAIVANAAETAVGGLRDGQIQNEETFTDRMLGAIAEAVRNTPVKEVRWSAMTLTAHQRASQETEFGADLLGVLDIALRDFRVQKGFLAQAKLVEPGEAFSQAEFDRLRTQCQRMLKHTPDSFVFLYSEFGVFVVPAISFMALQERRNPHELYSRSLARFFEEHFESFIGDRRIHKANKEALDELRGALAARRALMLRMTG